MNLVRFSQDMDINDPSKSSYYLVLDDDGEELRIPVLESSVQILVNRLALKSTLKVTQTKNKVPEVDSGDGTVFGGVEESATGLELYEQDPTEGEFEEPPELEEEDDSRFDVERSL